MFKSFKFLLQFIWVNLASVLGFAAIVVLGASVTGVSQGAENLFTTYLRGFPAIVLMVMFVLTFALCTNYLNMAVSFGARRKDYFWAVQWGMLVQVLACWGMQMGMSAVPELLHWPEADRWGLLMSLGNGPAWYYPLMLLSVMALGCVCGLLFVRSKVWGVIVLSVSMVLFMVGLVALLLAGDFYDGRWGDLRWLLPAIFGAVLAASEWGVWHTIKRFVVR